MSKSIHAWHARESAGFEDGTYKPVPVPMDYPVAHFLHLSVTETEADYVAFTPSDAYGVADRQVRLKFGRYLKKTFESLSDAEIQAHVTSLKSALSIADQAPVLKFATDRETINRIFETEMRACDSTAASCMHGKFDSDTVRPYHVYADSPDVAVAYVTVSDGIIARSVVSKKDMVWVRPYSVADGDSARDCGTLRELLKSAGYSKGHLYGNRLTKLKTSEVMLPYIDNGGAHVEDAGKYWVVCEDDGDYECDCTDGTATPCASRCERCDNDEDECECIYCECCDERYADGCNECSMCEECDGCTEHDHCNCNRCGDCNNIINPRSRYTDSCECSRCDECHELEDECGCSKCDECGRLTDDCGCEEDDSMPEVEAETVPQAHTDSDSEMTPFEVRNKLNRIWRYLVYERGIVADETAKHSIVSR